MPGRQPGDKVSVSIRPERLSFASEGKKPNLINCTVENITFLGSIVRIRIRLGNTLLNMDTFNNPFLELPKIGDPVEVTCSREAVLVIEQGVVSQ
jgi:putative spermidine/putrescine transport system ATP-binding protein